jgi:hypothetical protein
MMSPARSLGSRFAAVIGALVLVTSSWAVAPATAEAPVQEGAVPAAEEAPKPPPDPAPSPLAGDVGITSVPANDDFESAEALDGSLGVTLGSNVGATVEPGEPGHYGRPAQRSVWYLWIAPEDGPARLSTRGSTFDTMLSVYTGSELTGLTGVTSNDDYGQTLQSRVGFTATAGATYHIAVSGYSSGSQGSIVLQWTVNPPSNDDFSAALVLEGAEGTITGSNARASGEPGEPDHAGAPPAGSVWYRWTAPEDLWMRVRTFGSAFDTVLSVYTGPELRTLVSGLVAANDDHPRGAPQSGVAFQAAAGTTYHFAVAGKHDERGDLDLQWTALLANDDFVEAAPIGGPWGVTDGGNVGATVEPGEPGHDGRAPQRSVWYRWIAPEDGPARLSTRGSTFDTVLSVYTGSELTGLTGVASNDDYRGNLQSRVGFTATAGATYHIAVSGYSSGSQGSIVLQWTVNPPSNDDFSAALVLEGAEGTITGSNARASGEPGERDHAGAAPLTSVWYRFSVPRGVVRLSTAGSDFDTVLAVYRGSTLLAANDDHGGTPQSEVEFVALAGVTYDVAVAGAGGEAGNVVLSRSHVPLGPRLVVIEVVDELGDPVEGATVRSPQDLIRGLTGPDGRMTGDDLDDLPAATYHIEATDGSEPARTGSGFLAVPPLDDAFLQITLGQEAPRTLTLEVLDAAGAPLPAAGVVLLALSGSDSLFWGLPPDWSTGPGVFAFPAPPDTYQLWISPSGEFEDFAPYGVITVTGERHHHRVVFEHGVTPGVPTEVVAVPGAGQAEVSWTAPVSIGEPQITGYSVTASPGGATCTITDATACNVTGLTNGVAYAFAVVATNAAGPGPPSASSTPVTPRTVPGLPSGLTAVAGNGQVTVSWTAPSDDGGSPITGYRAEAAPGGQTCTTTSAGSCTVTGLANGTEYTFRVRARNAAGWGAWSAWSPQTTPRTVPGAPRNAAGTPGARSVTVRWAAPASNGGAAITAYEVVGSPGGRKCTTTGLRSCTVTGLANGTEYTFRVRARNAAGWGAWSAWSPQATPRTVPGAPRNAAGTPGARSVTVRWAAPASNGGAVITGYRVQATPGGRTCSTTGPRTCKVTGLTNGTKYRFEIQARNSAGWGPWSARSAAVVPRR